MRSAPPVSSVRLSGKNATDQTGSPGPTSVRSSLRARAVDDGDRAADAGGGDELAVAATARRAMIGVGPASISPLSSPVGAEDIDLAVGAGGDDLAVGRDRDRIERRRQRYDRPASRRRHKRPDAQRRVVAQR